MGVQGDDVEMGIRKHEEPTEVPVEPGGGTVQGGNPSVDIHSCLNGGNEISQFFGCPPPSLEEYLGVEV